MMKGETGLLRKQTAKIHSRLSGEGGAMGKGGACQSEPGRPGARNLVGHKAALHLKQKSIIKKERGGRSNLWEMQEKLLYRNRPPGQKGYEGHSLQGRKSSYEEVTDW